MLRHSAFLSTSPLHGVELAGLLFVDYMQSSVFRMDVAEALSDVNGWLFFFRSGFRPSVFLNFYSRHLTERVLFRLLECGISAACIYGGSDTCKDAIAFHYVYPIVRDYRYARFWCTRLLRLVGRTVCPGFLRRALGQGATSSAVKVNVPASERVARNASASGATTAAAPSPPRQPRLFERRMDDATIESEAAFYRNPPRPSRTEPFTGMPESCRDALRYYVYSYQSRPLYTAFVSGLITDVSLFTAEQLMWCTYFYQERKKPTSKWRVWKPYLSDLTGVATQSVLVYAARVTGILIGQKVSQEPTGGGIFWGEHLTLILLAPAIHYVSVRVGMGVRAALEQRHPRTIEDEMEDQRVEEELEEAARAQAAAARAAFVFTTAGSSTNSGSDAAGHAAEGGAGAGSSSGGGGNVAQASGPNFYEVLGVTESATAPEIKKAYRAMALRNHPDRAGKDAAAQQKAREQMSVINDAYNTLIDTDKRSQYDATRRFADGAELVKKLESMSTVQLFCVSAAALAGLSTLATMSAYGQYLTIFQRVTALGRGPLQLFT